ncbi:MAG: glycosyltransferase [Mangrovibacterium sp.]
MMTMNLSLFLPENSSVQTDGGRRGIYYIPMKWFYKTLDPILFFRFIWSIVVSCFFLVKIINKVRPDCIYANTTKACVYAVATKFFTRKKIIWHVRDQLNHPLLHRVLAKNSDIIISVSKYIDDQVLACECKKRLIYGGIDAEEWIVNPEQSGSLKKELGLRQDTMLIAQIGQLTRWKKPF